MDDKRKEYIRKQQRLMSIINGNGNVQDKPQFKTPEMIAEEFRTIYIESQNIQLSLNSIIGLIPSIIHFVEKMYKILNGQQKENLVLNIIKYLYVKEIENEDDRKILEKLLEDENLKMMIKNIVYIGHDTMTFIKKKIPKTGRCFC